MAAIGAILKAYVPDPAAWIALDFTDVRFYYATSEGGNYSLVGSETLSASAYEYSHNHELAVATGWFYWLLYGAIPGEGPASEPMPVGGPQSTRKLIRQAAGKRLRKVNVYKLASVTDAETAVISELIDPDASPHGIANRYARIVGGTATGQTRRVRAGTNGYTVASGTININRATSPAWAAGNEIELWVADGDTDPSAEIDEAMQRARMRVWWEDTFYLATTAEVSEYALPGIVRDEYVKRVEWAADSYPDRPGWTPVGWYDVTMDSGNPILTLRPSPYGRGTYSGGKIVRVVYNRPGDRMDSDTDYWEADLDWCALEVCRAYLLSRLTPRGGKEDIDDATRAMAAIVDELDSLRSANLPSAATRTRLPR